MLVTWVNGSSFVILGLRKFPFNGLCEAGCAREPCSPTVYVVNLHNISPCSYVVSLHNCHVRLDPTQVSPGGGRPRGWATKVYDLVMITVSEEEFQQLVEKAVAEIPERFAKHLENVAFMAADEPSPEQMRANGLLHGRSLLLGLYEGIPLPRRNNG